MSASNNILIINELHKYIKSHPALYKSFDFSRLKATCGRKQHKNKLNDYLDDILYVLKTGISWST